MYYSFRDYLRANCKFYREILESDDLSCFTLPIKINGELSINQSLRVKEALKFFLEKFISEINAQNYYIENDDHNLTIEQTDNTIDNSDEFVKLSLGIVERPENSLLCAYNDGTFFNAEDVKDLIANNLYNHIDDMKTFKCVIKKQPHGNPKLSVAYETIIPLSNIGNYNDTKTINVYLKFDFRKNEKEWYTDDHSHRYSSFDDTNTKTIIVPKENSKLCYISIHPSD